MRTPVDILNRNAAEALSSRCTDASGSARRKRLSGVLRSGEEPGIIWTRKSDGMIQQSNINSRAAEHEEDSQFQR